MREGAETAAASSQTGLALETGRCIAGTLNCPVNYLTTQVESSTRPGCEGLPPVANLLVIAPAEAGKQFPYYLGVGWIKAGIFPRKETGRITSDKAHRYVKPSSGQNIPGFECFRKDNSPLAHQNWMPVRTRNYLSSHQRVVSKALACWLLSEVSSGDGVAD